MRHDRGMLVDGGRSSASVFVRVLIEVRRSRCGLHDQRVRRRRLLLAADRARRLRVVRGRQHCSPRLASVWGSIFVRLRRGGLRQSALLLEGCGASWWVLSELVNLGGTALTLCLSCGHVRSRWSELAPHLCSLVL